MNIEHWKGQNLVIITFTIIMWCTVLIIFLVNYVDDKIKYKLGRGGVQGQGKGSG